MKNMKDDIPPLLTLPCRVCRHDRATEWGKSTLINTLLNQKIAAVSPKPQTTRKNQLGILTLPQAQLIFVDTPGLHIPQHKLGDYMNQAAMEALQDADLIVWLLDASAPFTAEDRLISEKLTQVRALPPTWMALTKVDLVDGRTLEERKRQALELFPAQDILCLSVQQPESLKTLLDLLITNLPPGEPFFNEETVTDAYERDIAAELIREAVLMNVRDEVPIALRDKLTPTKNVPKRKPIRSDNFCKRDSQKEFWLERGAK